MNKNADNYRLLIENLPDAIAYHQAVYSEQGEPTDYIFLEVNIAFETMTGLLRKDVIGRKVSEALPEIIKSKFDWVGTYGRLAAEGGTIRFENYSEPLQRYYEVTAYSDEKHYFATIFRDITESRQNEIELKYNEKRFSQAQLFAAMGTWEYILAEGKLYWSDECAKLFGIKPGEFRGDFESFLHFVHPEDREYVFNVNQPAVELKEGMTLHYEHRIVRKDGVVRWVREEAGPVMDEDGEVTKMVGMVIDVTEQVKGENELREKTEQLRGILESQQDLIVRIDLDGCYSYVNDAFCKISDRSRENLLGSSYVSLVHPDDLEITKHVIEGLFSKSQHDYLELRAMTIEGWRWFAWVGSAIRDINGKEIEIQGVGRDITTQKDAEAELIKIQAKLEELVKERTGELERANLNLQREIVERKKAETEIAHTLDIYRKALEGIILSMGTVMSKRDNYTAEHQLRVANLAVAIAEELGLEESRIEGLKLAAEVHDIGKISIPAEILTKPGELTDLEYMIIQTHPRSGYEILCSIDFPWPLAEIIVQHHEKIDGSGYPEGLRGDEILLEAKIICLADVVEAMASHRPYRASLGINAALEEIEQQRGILYDEGVVDACLRLFREKGYQLD